MPHGPARTVEDGSKQRLHQASFREAVIAAYNGRCAVSGLPESLLVDAAHIVADKDEQFGQPVVPNGIPLSAVMTSPCVGPTTSTRYASGTSTEAWWKTSTGPSTSRD